MSMIGRPQRPASVRGGSDPGVAASTKRPERRLPIASGVASSGCMADLVENLPVTMYPRDTIRPCEHALEVRPLAFSGGGQSWILPFAIVVYDNRGTVVSKVCAECMRTLPLPAHGTALRGDGVNATVVR